MKLLKLAVLGASGRMGKAVISCAKKDKRYSNKILKISRETDLSQLKDYDVVIDFSLPQALKKITVACEKFKVPLVSGTTGFKTTHNSLLKNLSKKAPVFYSSNLSLGIGFLNFLIGQHKKFLNNFRSDIYEIHHVHKLDSPSGTALTLKETLNKNLKQKVKSVKADRKGEEIGFHQVTFSSKEEKIHFSHKALKRSLFAQGALDVAYWLCKKKKGFYDMNDYFTEKGK